MENCFGEKNEFGFFEKNQHCLHFLISSAKQVFHASIELESSTIASLFAQKRLMIQTLIEGACKIDLEATSLEYP